MRTSEQCPIDGSPQATAEALKQTELFAAQTRLEGKDALHLRLLGEELLGVVNGLTEVLDGSYVVERDWDEYRIRLSARTFPFGEEAQRRLLSTSFTGENIFYKGVTGKLRRVADWYSSGADQAFTNHVTTEYSLVNGFVTGVESRESEWSLQKLRDSMEREQKAQAWDELEWSVLSCLADDVRVGLRFGKVAITVYTHFADKSPKNISK